MQAEHVAHAVKRHMEHCPNKSLGVACLSAQQRDAVDDMIDKLGIRTDVEAFCPREERLFVKNLEAVQGDERDVIFISVGYGVAPNQSRPFLNFGPVSRDGGERRLNVLASRAREKCMIFSSITAADIPADSEVRGTRMLRSLLHFAETGKLGAGTLYGADFDSEFEEAVARVVREAGFHVHAQVGVSNFRIDLGVIDPARPGEYVLGIECDGATYHSSRSARDRDRLRQQVLEDLGWRLHRICSTDWFRNPKRETEKLLIAIRNAAEKQTIEPGDADEENGVEVTQSDSGPDEEPERQPLELQDENPSSDAVHYKQCSLAVPHRRSILELSASELGRLSLAVVEAEGPIHTDEVARRLREAFGLLKTGSRIHKHFRNSLVYLRRTSLVARDGEFWSLPNSEMLVVRSRRNAPLPLRRAAMIAPMEYQLAIVSVLTEVVSVSPDELVVETARCFGFDRTGPDLRQEIDRQMRVLLSAGQIIMDGEVVRLALRMN